ncbi:MAG TPA: TrkA C-terminal domain-containing protein [Longimicrobiales bacterium]|nr:TrkA C-terminal domain-containing protein [Longimicrobiales bacterium]
MIAILSVLAVVAVSALVTRIAAIALQLTGVSKETARFQARSAFTGVGFTTGEAESVMLHPDRRRIILLLMLLGSAGLVTAIASVVQSFAGTGSTSEALWRGLVLVSGLALLAALAHSGWIERHLARTIERVLRRVTDLDLPTYASLLDLMDEFIVSRLEVAEASWLADRTLEELRLPEEGVLVLGIIRRDGSYVGSPRGRYTLRPRETVILYGPAERVHEIQRRLSGPGGHEAHRGAKQTHSEALELQDAQQRRYAERGAG